MVAVDNFTRSLRAMLIRPLAFLWLGAMCSCLPLVNAQTTNVYYSGFETAQDLDDWGFSGPWQIGVPTFGPSTNSLGRRAYSGTNCAATVLGGNYTENTSGRLESKSFVVPAVANNPRLRWAHWYAVNSSDSGRLQVKVGAGAWTDLTAYPTLTGSGSGAWSEAGVDLSAYAGQNIQVGFLFTSATTGGVVDPTRVGPGWYIDDMRVVTGPHEFNNPEGFENGWAGFHVEGGSWELGTPAQGVGPGQAHTGTQCVGTVLDGNYADGFGSVGANFGRLVSPPFLVPPAVTNPRLRFWHWHSFSSDDVGQVEIKTGANNWQTIVTYTANSSGVWSRPDVNLSAYAGQTVQLGFRFASSRTGGVGDPIRVGPGWYIDEVRLLHEFSVALLDSPILRAQDASCIPLGVAASTLTPTVSFTLHAPAGHLGNLTLNTEGCWSGGLASLADSQWLVSLTNSCPSAATGVQNVGTLCFTAISAQSAFVPLTIGDLNAGVSPTHIFDSRAVVIANEPLLESWLGANRQRMLTLYGIAGTSYEIRHAPTVDTPAPWNPGWTNAVPASLFTSFPLTGAASNAPSLFLRAFEQ